MSVSPDPVAVKVLRAGAVESRHRAHVVVASADGAIHARFGDPAFPTYTRSIVKPFQLLPLLTSGAAERFAFTDTELATMCASHNGEPGHVKTVEGILQKIGADAGALRCGAHAPYHDRTAKSLAGPPTPLHNNCSGKHAGMIALAMHLGQDPATYLDPRGRVQQEILRVVAALSATPADRIPAGVDGCSAPTFHLPLANAARLMAHLANPQAAPEAPQRAALARVARAIAANPWHVAGTDRLDTAVMDAAEGRLLSKAGGEAIQSVMDLETGQALLVKIEDGGGRAVAPATLDALRQLGWIEARALEVLGELWRPALKNHAGLVVGGLEPVLELQRTGVPVVHR